MIGVSRWHTDGTTCTLVIKCDFVFVRRKYVIYFLLNCGTKHTFDISDFILVCTIKRCVICLSKIRISKLNESGFITKVQVLWSKSLGHSSGQGSLDLLTAISNSLPHNSFWDPNKRIGSALLRQVRLHLTGGITAFHFPSLERFSEVPH